MYFHTVNFFVNVSLVCFDVQVHRKNKKHHMLLTPRKKEKEEGENYHNG